MNGDFEQRLRAQIDQLEAQRAKLQAELARVDGHLGGLRQALSLFLGEGPRYITIRRSREPGARSRVPDPARSPSWAFVLEVLRQAPPAGVSVDDIAQQGERAGHAMARNTLRSNLSNAASEGLVQRVSTGHYRLPSLGESPGDMQPEQATPAQEGETPDEDESPGVSRNGGLPFDQPVFSRKEVRGVARRPETTDHH